MTTCISLLTASHVSERMINERILTRTACRKLFLATGKYFSTIQDTEGRVSHAYLQRKEEKWSERGGKMYI